MTPLFNMAEGCNHRVYSFQHKSPSRRKYSFGSTNSQCSDDDNDSEVGSISSERSYGSRGSRNHHKVLEPGNVSYSQAHTNFERFSFSKKLGCHVFGDVKHELISSGGNLNYIKSLDTKFSSDRILAFQSVVLKH